MLYLATQHAWWLLAALAIGLVIGAIGPAGAFRGAFRSLLVAALLWAAAAATVWSRWLNGDAALLVETALLYVAVYVVGCLLGSVLAPGARRAEASGAQ